MRDIPCLDILHGNRTGQRGQTRRFFPPHPQECWRASELGTQQEEKHKCPPSVGSQWPDQSSVRQASALALLGRRDSLSSLLTEAVRADNCVRNGSSLNLCKRWGEHCNDRSSES